MRRSSFLLLLPLMTSGLVVVPTVSVPSASASPVPPTVRELPVTGLDRAALARSPRPEDELVAPGRAHLLAPLAATPEMVSAPFSAVGVTWAADARLVDVAVQVRTRSHRGWGDWTELEVQLGAAPDGGTPPSHRVGSDLLHVGRSDAVQVRVDAGQVKPHDVRVALIDPGTSPADAAAARDRSSTLGGSIAHAAATEPAYVSRREWGADESLRNCTPSYASTLKGGILHTTATSNNYTAAQSPAVMRSMYAYHTRSLGWCDLGYNLVVDKYGTLFEGRAGGISRPVVGTHTGGFNTGTVGISMIGHHDQVAPSADQLRTVAHAFGWKLGLHGVSATGTTTYRSGGGSATKHPAGAHVTSPVISGHRDYSAKSCPGNLAYPRLPEIRSAAADGQRASAPAASTSPSATPTATASPTTGAETPTLVLPPALRPEATPVPTGTPTSIPTTAPPTRVTTLVASADRTRLAHGGSTVLRGRLTSAAGPIAPATVEVLSRRTGSTTWVPLTRLSTARDGSFALTSAPKVSTSYGFRYRGGPHLSASSRDVAVTVASVVRAAFSASTTRVGARVWLRGTVTPAHAGQAVQRQVLVDGAWRTYGTARLSSTGSYAFPVTWKTKGARTYRVVKLSDGDHVRASGPHRTLTVR